jgi:hypothetical protein
VKLINAVVGWDRKAGPAARIGKDGSGEVKKIIAGRRGGILGMEEI